MRGYSPDPFISLFARVWWACLLIPTFHALLLVTLTLIKGQWSRVCIKSCIFKKVSFYTCAWRVSTFGTIHRFGSCPYTQGSSSVIWNKNGIKSRSTASMTAYSNWLHTPTDYRHTDKHLRLVMAFIALYCTRQSWTPNIDRNAPENWPWPMTLTSTFDLDPDLWPLTR